MKEIAQISKSQKKLNGANLDNFVLEKSIFNNVFEKDIRRVYIYKKAERLGRAVHLISPAFIDSVSLRNRIDAIVVGLIDSALLLPGAIRAALARELLALSSILSIAQSGKMLSQMNIDLILREAEALLQEVALYEEPRISIEETPTLSGVARALHHNNDVQKDRQKNAYLTAKTKTKENGSSQTDIPKGHKPKKDRRSAILSIMRNKGHINIKDISMLIRGVSEKTIQRELLVLISEGLVVKKGVRRWSTYSLTSSADTL